MARDDPKTMSIIDQSEVINRAHGIKAFIEESVTGLAPCFIQRWRGYLGEYDIPKLRFPMIALISGGRAKIRRIKSSRTLSIDYAMPGDITLIPRDQDMRWHVNGEVDVIAFTFENPETCDHLQNVYNKILSQSRNKHYVGSFTNAYIFTTCNHLTNILSDPESVSRDYIATQVQALELYILNYLGNKNDGLHPIKENHSHYVDYAMQRLNLGVKSKIHVEDIARELRVSPAYLTKKFKDEVGITPHHFLLLTRIKKAQSLLAETDVDIATIAQESGFSHQSHLTRHFSREIGMSPFKFRQYAQKGIEPL
ncbi:MAG: helix-turn-helix transcriptional regulator [Porticoccaceae bacterium]|nr:helix-turn-helix transcriptional regulator [Porticoccaceae bacterium]